MSLSNIQLLQNSDPEVNQLQINIKTVLAPVIGNPVVGGLVVGPVALTVGLNNISHGLGQTLQGWWVVSPQGVTNVYQVTGVANPAQILTVNSSAAVTVSFYVF
jgi:hypothetical protein